MHKRSMTVTWKINIDIKSGGFKNAKADDRETQKTETQKIEKLKLSKKEFKFSIERLIEAD